MSELVRRAFVCLGEGPTRAELDLVADVLRRSDDDEALTLIYDDDRSDELAAIATAAGSNPLVALDLQTTVAYGVEALTAGPTRRR